MLPVWLQWLQLIGGIAGLVSFLFVALDRLVRGRLVAWPVVHSTGAGRSLWLRIYNPGRSDAFVATVQAIPRGYQIGRDLTTESAVKASLSDRLSAVIPAGEHVDFPLFKPDHAAAKARLRIRWSKMNTMARAQLPVTIKLVPKTLRELRVMD